MKERGKSGERGRGERRGGRKKVRDKGREVDKKRK